VAEDRVFRAKLNMSSEAMNKMAKVVVSYLKIILVVCFLFAMFLLFSGVGTNLSRNLVPYAPIGFIVIIVAFILYRAYTGVFYTVKEDKLVIDRFGQILEIKYSKIISAEKVVHTEETSRKTTAFMNEVEIKYIDKVGIESSTIVCPAEEKEFLSMLRKRMAQAKSIPGEGNSLY